MKKHLLLTIGIVTLIVNSGVLTGCANAALVATDPRPVATTTSDQYNKRNLQVALMGDEYKTDHVSVDAYNNQILLTGQASSYMQRYKIKKLAENTKGVTNVYNYIDVSKTYNSTTMADTEITAKVKSLLFSKSNVNSNDVQVITSNGVVYLFGIVYKKQLSSMVITARSVSGVKNVVPLVQYKKSDTKINLPS